MLNSANATMQLDVRPALRGRVMALYMMIFMGGTPLGSPVDRLGRRDLRRPLDADPRRRPGASSGVVVASSWCSGSNAGAARRRRARVEERGRRPRRRRRDQGARRFDPVRGATSNLNPCVWHDQTVARARKRLSRRPRARHHRHSSRQHDRARQGAGH